LLGCSVDDDQFFGLRLGPVGVRLFPLSAPAPFHEDVQDAILPTISNNVFSLFPFVFLTPPSIEIFSSSLFLVPLTEPTELPAHWFKL